MRIGLVGTAFPFPALSLPVMNSFLSVCGVVGPLQLNVECQGMPEVECLSFDTPFVLIGRDPISDMQFLHPDVSDRHAYLQMVGGRLFCVDLGSRQGTYLAGKRQRSGWVGHLRAIRVGPYRIRLVAGDDDTPAPGVEPRPEELPLPLREGFNRPRLTLELSHRVLRSSRCQIHSAWSSSGSAADCQVRLLDPSVSNYHCSLLQTSLGIWVVDLLGQGGGVGQRGQGVRDAQVHDGDELRLGHSIRFHLDPEPAGTALTPQQTPASSAPKSDTKTPVGRILSSRRSARASETREAEFPGGASVGCGRRRRGMTHLPRSRDSASASPASPAIRPRSSRQSSLRSSIIFNVMQQQLVEQFLSGRYTPFETFSTLHEEHVGIFREELETSAGSPRLARRSAGRADDVNFLAHPHAGAGGSSGLVRRIRRCGSVRAMAPRPRRNGNGHSNENGNGHSHTAVTEGLGLTQPDIAQASETPGTKAAIVSRAEERGPIPRLPSAIRTPRRPSHLPPSASGPRTRVPSALKPGRKIDADVHTLLYQADLDSPDRAAELLDKDPWPDTDPGPTEGDHLTAMVSACGQRTQPDDFEVGPLTRFSMPSSSSSQRGQARR